MDEVATAGGGIRRGLTLLARGIGRRCPNCGGRDVFEAWIRPRNTCPGCGLRLDRGEEDFFLGAYTVNFVTAELLLAAFLALAVILTWPDVPWTLILYVGVALMIIAPIAFFPFSRTLWLAIDLAFRPASERDFARRE